MPQVRPSKRQKDQKKKKKKKKKERKKREKENVYGRDDPEESKNSSVRIQFKKFLQLISCI